MANDLTSGAVVGRDRATGSTRLPRDILILGGVAAQLWVITAIWMALDLGSRLDHVTVTETDVWLLALSGLIFVVLAILPIVLIWGKLLFGVSGLLVINLLLRRCPVLLRWAISLVGASLLVLLPEPGPTGPDGGADAATAPRQDGMPTEAAIAAREQELAARCARPRDPNIIAYCRARDEALRLLDDPG